MPATLTELQDRVQSRQRLRRDLPPPAIRRALRTSAGCSLEDVAQVVGVTRQAVGFWEAGERKPRGENLDRYVNVLTMLRRTVNET